MLRLTKNGVNLLFVSVHFCFNFAAVNVYGCKGTQYFGKHANFRRKISHLF